MAGRTPAAARGGAAVALAVIDGAAWLLGIPLGVLLRFEFDHAPGGWAWTFVIALAAAAVQIVAGLATSLYRGRFRYGSFEEIRLLGIIVIVISIALAIVTVTWGAVMGVPRGTPLLACPLVLLLMLAIRYGVRLYHDTHRRPAPTAEPALVIGGGWVADKVLGRVMTDPRSAVRPVGILDDDPAKKNLLLRGVPVLGTTDQLAEVAQRTGATHVIIAIGNVDSRQLRRFSDAAQACGLSVAVTPLFSEIESGEQNPATFRDVSIEDLIGRNPVDTNVDLVAGYIAGKRVLVTGAGGSIGSELCRQLAQFGAAELMMLDRDETGLQMAQLGTAGHGLLDTRDVILADIRDADQLNAIFDDRRPEVVFHAAALKHLPMLEQYPEEAWKTNVLGSLNVIDAARRVGVSTFVNVSTDKAANPTSALGHSKRVAEKLTAWAGEETGMRYLSVRFGNVIGSRGSMLPTFQRLIEEGKPLTVTHPEATRYFMTIPEACQLVIQAGGIGRAGEVLILDMGEPVSILEVAQRMIAMSGKDIDIVFTGLREGEKLHEELVGAHENLERPFHPQISHARADRLSPERLDKDEWMRRLKAAPEHEKADIDG